MKGTVTDYRIRVSKLARELQVSTELQKIYDTSYANNADTTAEEHEDWITKISDLIRTSADTLTGLRAFEFDNLEDLVSMLETEKSALKKMHKRLADLVGSMSADSEVVAWVFKIKEQESVVDILTKMLSHQNQKVVIKC